MGVASLDARLLASAYRAFGEPARWVPSAGDTVEGLTVRRDADEDADVDFGANSRALVARSLLRIRTGELAEPTKGGVFEILDAEGAVLTRLKVKDRPMRIRMGLEWRIEVEAVD